MLKKYHNSLLIKNELFLKNNFKYICMIDGQFGAI